MAWCGTRSAITGLDPVYQFAYWGVFLAALLVALYMALLDLRYVRMQYSLGEKELFEDTLGSEDFRTVLRNAREPHPDREDGHRND